jgi:hypothetical protein
MPNKLLLRRVRRSVNIRLGGAQVNGFGCVARGAVQPRNASVVPATAGTAERSVRHAAEPRRRSPRVRARRCYRRHQTSPS